MIQSSFLVLISLSCHPTLSSYHTIQSSRQRGPFETEQPDEHEDRVGPAGQPLLHDGGAQLVEGAELKTPEAAQLHGGVYIVIIIVIFTLWKR